MNQNDKRNDQNNKGNKNLQGALRLVAWALLLTLVLRYAGLYINSRSGNAASAEIPYSTFITLIEDGKAEFVRFDSDAQLLRLTTKGDYTYTDEDGKAFTGKSFYTVPINNDDLIPLLTEKGVGYTAGPYSPPMSTGMALLISYVLPFLLIMLMFSLFWRWMSKKGGMGGIGGIGGVGKANAKVYMEKQTGVTFRDVAGQDEAKESLTQIIDFLLGLSVVALGYLLHEQISQIKGNVIAIVTAIVTGSAVGILSVALIARAMGAEQAVIASLEPKSVTTAIALNVSAQSGGIPALTAVVVILVGIFGGVAGPFILKKIGVESKIAKGLAMGAAAHAMGTARAMQLGAVEGAISGLAIGLMGIATAILVPIIARLL